ncbi:MAG TPA: peptide chain release factor N(5)-glutamine methyltransferase, partial [Dehalococcoidia bacterium]|nr:peptide chain release factor N(5)-glutamine methyltransferase [Dehalococcoidia bacterium]
GFIRDLRKDVSLTQQQKICRFIERRQQKEPLAYITGRKEFFGLDFVVNQHVLVPRTETELIVEKVINYFNECQSSTLKIVDIGTGSGVIGVSLSHNLSFCDVLCTDISPEALLVAQKNAEIHNVNKVTFLEGDLLSPVHEKQDVILSNPPYIPSDRISHLQEEVQREPIIALDGGDDGFKIIERLLLQSSKKLNNPGLILIEIDITQVRRSMLEASKYFPDNSISILKDCFDNDRFLKIELF